MDFRFGGAFGGVFGVLITPFFIIRAISRFLPIKGVCHTISISLEGGTCC